MEMEPAAAAESGREVDSGSHRARSLPASTAASGSCSMVVRCLLFVDEGCR